MTVKELVNWLSMLPQDLSVTTICGKDNPMESYPVIGAYLISEATMDDINQVVLVTE